MGITSSQEWLALIENAFDSDLAKWSYFEIRHTIKSICKGKTDDETSQKTQQIVNYAHSLYLEAIKTENIRQLLKSLYIQNILKGTIESLDFSLISRSFLEKIRHFFDSMSLKIGEDEDIYYGDKRIISALETAAEQKDNFRIVYTLQSFYEHPFFDNLQNGLISISSQLLWHIDRDYISNFLKEEKWSFKMEGSLSSLKNEYATIIPLVIDGKNQYAYIYMIKALFNDMDQKINRKDLFLRQMPDFSTIIGEFIEHYGKCLSQKGNIFGLASSKSFNFFAGQYCSQHQNTLKEYLPLLNEVYDEAQESFCHGYLRSGDPSRVFDDSWAILTSWASARIRYFDRPNQTCGLVQLLTFGLAYNYKTKEQYLEKMHSIFNEIDDLQYTWGERNYSQKIAIALYFTLANKQTRFVLNETEIREHAPILFDRRYEQAFGKKLRETMLKVLQDPNSVENIELVDRFGNEKRLMFRLNQSKPVQG